MNKGLLKKFGKFYSLPPIVRDAEEYVSIVLKIPRHNGDDGDPITSIPSKVVGARFERYTNLYAKGLDALSDVDVARKNSFGKKKVFWEAVFKKLKVRMEGYKQKVALYSREITRRGSWGN